MLAEAMRRAQDGDRRAYALVLAHGRDAFTRLARERCPAGVQEHEIVHRCLVTLHRARHTFDLKQSFAAWLEAVARHHRIGPVRLEPRRAWRARIGGCVGSLRGIANPPPDQAAMIGRSPKS